MSKNYQPLIPHARPGGKFSFISYSNYSIMVQAPRDAERGGDYLEMQLRLWEGLFVALSSCPFHPERLCGEPVGEGQGLMRNPADCGWGIPGFPRPGCSTERPPNFPCLKIQLPSQPSGPSGNL